MNEVRIPTGDSRLDIHLKIGSELASAEGVAQSHGVVSSATVVDSCQS